MTAKTTNQKNNDMMLKVIAVICAVLLWFYVDAQVNPSGERQLAVPITYVNLASDYVVENGGQSVQVTIKGKNTDIMSLRSDDFTAVVDLSNAAIGSEAYGVQVTAANVSERFTYTPDKVTVTLDRIEQKEVPVRLHTGGTMPQYYELKSTELQPNTVTIRGKSKLLADISYIETELVTLNALNKDTEQNVALYLPEGVTVLHGNEGFQKEGQIAVKLSVQPTQSSKTYDALIAMRNVPVGMTAALTESTAKISLRGSAEQLETQPILDIILLYVDCTELTAGQHVLPIQVEQQYPIANVTLYAVAPQTATVILTPEGVTIPLSEESSVPGNNDGQSETDSE